ncbi:hypothetical protein [Halobacterium noricense]|uniref:hypothetical protein n=1 Tax=Halobacterium noricense TaxID=223182 RepID=UPI001E370FF3|nr:hypothetical protein [Halobacterium noricense]UHH26537.1 hypothetical protein LT974_06255 [Halobacterium noricense]
MERNDCWGDHPVELEEALKEQLKSDVSDVGAGSNENLDEETEDRLRELGYIE